jgi:hypothetical protein
LGFQAAFGAIGQPENGKLPMRYFAISGCLWIGWHGGLHGVVRGATREMAKARDDDFSFAETRIARFQAASGLGKISGCLFL